MLKGESVMSKKNRISGIGSGKKVYLFMAMILAVFTGLLCLPGKGVAAGLLKAVNGGDVPISIQSHKVDVTINNGFARTAVDQVFGNNGDVDLEAVYSLPLPKQASLSEVSLWIDGAETLGEVVEKERARKIYEEQRAKGNDTALAEKKDFKTFDISVGKVPAGGETRVRVVYYQPLEIDLNIGRYLYPLAEGNVDEERIAFWTVDDHVKGAFSFHLQLKSAFPLKDVRLPGFQNDALIQKIDGAGEEQGGGETWDVVIDKPEGLNLNQDIVFYYRLDDSVPGRVELIPFRNDPTEDGTFMVVVTPAADLKPIQEGSDWVFILDVSGSMQGHKISTLADGVCRSLDKMSANDRFRVITFSNKASDVTGGFIQATPENVREWGSRIKSIPAGGSTNLYDGLYQGYKGLDDDRTTGIILVTDGVTNTGPTEHVRFLELLHKYDLRLFTFVIGNNANQPLLDRLARDSGGFAMNISDADDITGRLMQAKAKVLHECLHDVELKIKGERVKDLTPVQPGNLYLGQQLVMFGRYTGDGEVRVILKGKISGQDKTWETSTVLPEVDRDNPELERLWAMSRVDELMDDVREKGEMETLRGKIVDLGTSYSLVTDYTSMVVVRDEVFETEKIDRKNARRVETERQAQKTRAAAPAKNYRVDNNNQGGMFSGRPSPNIGSGPVGFLFVGVLAWLDRQKKKMK
jgi:Ca-activated chloride channel homolog